MSNNSKSLIVKANGQNFEVTVKPVKASEIVTGEGEGSAAPRPANNGRRNNVRTNSNVSGSEANESGAGNAPVLANAALTTPLPENNQEGGKRRRNKRKGTRRNKRKGTRRNKRN